VKQLIVLVAVLPLLLIFFLQFSLDQQNAAKITLLNQLVSSAKEEARQYGCFPLKLQQRLKSEIANALKISESEISIEATENIRYRILSAENLSESQIERGLISYKITVPIGKMMAGKSLFGFREEDNVYRIQISGKAASERLPQ